MTIAFAYRRRAEDVAPCPAVVGERITFDERAEYVLTFSTVCPPPIAIRLRELGGEMIGPEVGVLTFGNFVGQASFAGVMIDVISTKIGPGGVSRVLEEISRLASNLVFGWRAPAGLEAGTRHGNHSPVPYHQLQLLRQTMLNARTGERLQDWLSAIERSPTRRFEPERPVLSPERVRRLDSRAISSIFSRMERLVPLPDGTALAHNQLAEALTFGIPPRPHFPAGIAAPRGRLSFDTPENRFVKHVIAECLALVYRFVDHPKLHGSLRADCRQMLGVLEQIAAAPFLGEAGRLSAFLTPSQALLKADGYREVLEFWSALTSHASLPQSVAETTRLLEGRDMATLYEYWVFLKVLEATVKVTGIRPTGPPTIQQNELGDSLAIGLSCSLGSDVRVRFNPSYMRSKGTAYSTPLRPDVVLEFQGRSHAFDAKYRLERFDVYEGDPDDGSGIYKRADLYKMHTYRDAIIDLATAFVVYPGSEFVFFGRSGKTHSAPDTLHTPDGVGAIPLRPADEVPAAQLEETIRALVTPRPPATASS